MLLYDVTSRYAEADRENRDPQLNIADPRKGSGSVVDALHHQNLNKYGQHI